MVTVTWTPRLIHAVKEFKKLDKSKVASLFNDRQYMDKFRLSYTEEQAMTSIIMRNTTPASINAYWF